MAEYRRDKTNRVFFRIEEEKGRVRKISNKMYYVAIQDYYEQPVFAEEALLDYESATEEQFNEAFKEARDRILLDRL